MTVTRGMTDKKNALKMEELVVYHCQKCEAKGYEAEVLDEVALELWHKACWECGSGQVEETQKEKV